VSGMGFVWSLTLYHERRENLYKKFKKPNKINGFWHLTNAYII